MVLPDKISFGELLGPAMKITDQAEADEYFDAMVARDIRLGYSREQAEAMEKENIGYYAGYCDNATRERVERLFNTKHPVFGSVAGRGIPTAESAFTAGRKLGELDKTRLLGAE